MIHYLKTKPDYFQAVIDGRKPMEIRYNDRHFRAEDKCLLREFEGIQVIPTCADVDTCGTYDFIRDEYNGEEMVECPLNRDSCNSYRKEVYTGRDCLIRIKDIFDLTGAGFEDYVAFTFDILNIRDKRKGG